MKTPAEIGREMFLLNTYEDYGFVVILSVLVASDELYYNDDEAFLEDNEYDALRLYAERLNPAHVYFTGVGSAVRGGKVKLPFEMGSLDQVEIGSITDWVGNWSLQEEGVIITDVEPDSPAARKNVKPGDVIVEVTQEEVRQPHDVVVRLQAVKRSGRGRVLLLLSDAKGELRFVAVPTS